MGIIGYKHTEEAKKKISLSRIGKFIYIGSYKKESDAKKARAKAAKKYYGEYARINK